MRGRTFLKILLGITAGWLMLPRVFAQGGSITGQVFTTQGIPAANSLVRICGISSTGNPCTPPSSSIYSDPGLTNPLSNPTATDQFGNYSIFVSPGYYIVQITVPGATYSQTLAAFAGGGSGTCAPTGTNGYFLMKSGTGCTAGFIDEGQVTPFTTTTTDGQITLHAVFDSPNGSGDITINASPDVLNGGSGNTIDAIASGEDGIKLCTDPESTAPDWCPVSGEGGPIDFYSGNDFSAHSEGSILLESLGSGMTLETRNATSEGTILISSGPGTMGSVADIMLGSDRNIDLDAAQAGGAGVVEMSGDSAQINMPVTIADTESGLASQFNLTQNGVAAATVANSTSIAAPVTVSSPSVLVLPTAPCTGFLQAATDTSGVMPITCGSGGGVQPITCASSIAFSATASVNYLPLSCNVTSSTIPSGVAGACTVVQISQVGGFTIVWPTTIKGAFSPSPAASLNSGTFCWDVADTAWVASGQSLINQ